MTKLKINTKAPNFTLPDESGINHSLDQYLGNWVLVYFYPKDDTPGCTKQACILRDSFPKFEKLNTFVIGISVDEEEDHFKFKNKYKLPFILLSDNKKEVVKKYDVWKKKNFLGREFFGTTRTSFLINPDNMIIKIYENVKPANHADEVLADISEFIK